MASWSPKEQTEKTEKTPRSSSKDGLDMFFIGRRGASSGGNAHPSQAGFLRLRGLLECVRRIRCARQPRSFMMISRLTIAALVFAVLGTASLGFAVQAQSHELKGASIDVGTLPVIQLPRVEVIGHRSR
jgi:hypothetical protein